MSKGKEQGSSEVFFCLGPAFLMASFMPVLLSFFDLLEGVLVNGFYVLYTYLFYGYVEVR